VYSINNCGLSRDQYQLIWIDDGSNELEVNRVMSGLKPDISIIKTANEGTVKTKNIGLLLAGGQYIAMIDSDFKMMNNWLSIADECLSKIKTPIILCMSDLFRSNWESHDIIIDGITFKEMGVNMATGAFIMHREVLDTVGFLDEDFGFYGLNDSEWTARVRKAGYKVVYLSDLSGHHMGQIGEVDDQRERKQKSMSYNREVLDEKLALNRIYYCPFLAEDVNKIIDNYIQE